MTSRIEGEGVQLFVTRCDRGVGCVAKFVTSHYFYNYLLAPCFVFWSAFGCCVQDSQPVLTKCKIQTCCTYKFVDASVVFLCFFITQPPAKWHYRDVMMHAVHTFYLLPPTAMPPSTVYICWHTSIPFASYVPPPGQGCFFSWNTNSLKAVLLKKI